MRTFNFTVLITDQIHFIAYFFEKKSYTHCLQRNEYQNVWLNQMCLLYQYIKNLFFLFNVL